MSSQETHTGQEGVLYETHMHTVLCRHATGEIGQYAAVARKRGLAGIVVTCHNPLPGGYSQDVRMYPEQLPEYFRLVAQARWAWEGRIDVRLGLECDYVPGMEAFLEKQAATADWDYLLGSVHPHVGEYRRVWYRGNAVDFQRAYFEHLSMAAETRLFDCLSHPDVVKNVFPGEWNVQRIMPDICRALDRIAAAGVAMELNTSGLMKDIPEMNPGLAMLKEMRKRNIPVVIGADAHAPEFVGWHFEAACDMLRDAGYRQASFFLGRKRVDVDLVAARRSLAPLEENAADLV